MATHIGFMRTQDALAPVLPSRAQLDVEVRMRLAQGLANPLPLHAPEPLLDDEAGDRSALRDALDRALAALLLVAAAPVMLAVAAAVVTTSPGPALFAQWRVGLGGSRFRMLKFRSMVSDAESREAALAAAGRTGDGPFFKVRDDDRITRVGRFIRRTSLDELPQLLNVVRGEMSLVGPRPLLMREYDALPANAKDWRYRVRPGITGLWQVSGRSRTTASTRLRLDRLYVDNAGLGTDLAILARTPAAVLRLRDVV